MRTRMQYWHRVLSLDSSQEKTYQSHDMLQPPAPKKQKKDKSRAYAEES